jgi:hypothetical protein
MYAFGYGNPSKARNTLDYVDFSQVPCIQCESCKVNCASGFDIKRKVIEIAKLKDVPEEFLVG